MRALVLTTALAATLVLAGCVEAPPPPEETVADQAKDNGNPLANTVLDTQGRALQKAKDVQKLVDERDKAQREAIDGAEGE